MRKCQFCGKTAYALVKTDVEVIKQLAKDKRLIGNGHSSTWMLVCEEHSAQYPDFDGILINAIPQ